MKGNVSFWLLQRKKTVLLISIILLAASLITGTYAVVENAAHSGKALSYSSPEPQVTLINAFDPPDSWEIGQEVPKSISVVNLPEGEKDVFIRITIKEHMRAALLGEYIKNDDGSNMLFVIHTGGENLGRYMLYAEAQEQNLKCGKYVFGETEYAVITEDAQQGLSGKPMRGESVQAVWGLTDETALRPHVSIDCGYPVYVWNSDGVECEGFLPLRNYIELNLGPDTVLLSAWNGRTGPFWILDDKDGGAYWGEALKPGQQTAELMRGLTLRGLPEENADIEYKIHVDMEAADLADLAMFKTSASSALIEKLLET